MQAIIFPSYNAIVDYMYLIPNLWPNYRYYQVLVLVSPNVWGEASTRIMVPWRVFIARLERGSRQCCDPATHGM